MDAVQKQRVTLLDIAADADVSRSTASLVIRNVPSVAETTRKRVLRSIKKLGYVYHRGAANLRRQHSHAVGLIVSDITNPFLRGSYRGDRGSPRHSEVIGYDGQTI